MERLFYLLLPCMLSFLSPVVSQTMNDKSIPLCITINWDVMTTMYSTLRVTLFFVNNSLTNSLITGKFLHNAFDIPT